MSALLRPAVGVALTVGVLVSGACWFERRPEPRNGEEDGATPPETTVVVSDGGVRDSVRAVVTAFHDALRVGDGGRVASLSVSGATIVDQEDGVAWRLGPGGGDRLPGALDPSGTGLGWEPAGTDLFVSEGTALVVDRYTATVAGEAVPWTAVETLVLERTAEGWRLRHVHRSRGGGPPAAGSAQPSDEEPA